MVRWVLLGAGIGLVAAGLALAAFEREIPEGEVVRRARALGMVYREEVLPFAKAAPPQIVVAIPPGMSAGAAADVLVRAGAAADAAQLLAALQTDGGEAVVQAGIYAFTAGENSAEVARKLESGEVMARWQ